MAFTGPSASVTSAAAPSISGVDQPATGSPTDGVTTRRDRRGLALASVLVLVGSLTPWVDTAFGNLGGLAGGGLWTLYAGAIGLAGAVWRRRRVLAVHAAVLAAPALVLPAWQIARLVPLGGFGRGWVPGFGLVAVFGGGVIAARIALRSASPRADATDGGR